MEMENEKFSYEYSAKKQEEIQKIRQKYLPKSEDKMEQLKRMDETVMRKATISALAVGIISTLVMGIGMCCCMVWSELLFVPGIIIGIAGILGAACAYPLYNRTLKKERERIAPEILRLTEELLK